MTGFGPRLLLRGGAGVADVRGGIPGVTGLGGVDVAIFGV